MTTLLITELRSQYCWGEKEEKRYYNQQEMKGKCSKKEHFISLLQAFHTSICTTSSKQFAAKRAKTLINSWLEIINSDSYCNNSMYASTINSATTMLMRWPMVLFHPINFIHIICKILVQLCIFLWIPRQDVYLCPFQIILVLWTQLPPSSPLHILQFFSQAFSYNWGIAIVVLTSLFKNVVICLNSTYFFT